MAVRYLLHLGFGVEARRLIDLTGDDMPDADSLRAVGHLLDGAELPPGNTAFADMETCDSAAALWATLASPVSAPASAMRMPCSARSPTCPCTCAATLAPHLLTGSSLRVTMRPRALCKMQSCVPRGSRRCGGSDAGRYRHGRGRTA